jgi:hypothetical protein
MVCVVNREQHRLETLGSVAKNRYRGDAVGREEDHVGSF